MAFPLNLYQHVNSRRVKAARQHLDLAFADALSEERKEQIISNSLKHFMKMPWHTLKTSRWSSQAFHDKISISDDSQANLQEAIDANQGVIVLTCHLGQFELSMRYLADVSPQRIAILTKEFSPAWLNNIVQGRRRRYVDVIYKKGAARSIFSTLKNKKVVAMLLDQNRPDGIFVPFFNRLAATSPLAATFSSKLGALIVPACCVHDQNSYQVIINKPFVCQGDGDQAKVIEDGTLRCNQEMEKLIVQFPDQYLWTHMRYKTCAPGQAPLYD